MLPHKLRARLSGLDIYPNALATNRMRYPTNRMRRVSIWGGVPPCS